MEPMKTMRPFFCSFISDSITWTSSFSRSDNLPVAMRSSRVPASPSSSSTSRSSKLTTRGLSGCNAVDVDGVSIEK